MRIDGNEFINGATLDKNTCLCEVNQSRTWYSKQSMNCFFKTARNTIEGEYFINLSHIFDSK